MLSSFSAVGSLCSLLGFWCWDWDCVADEHKSRLTELMAARVRGSALLGVERTVVDENTRPRLIAIFSFVRSCFFFFLVPCKKKGNRSERRREETVGRAKGMLLLWQPNGVVSCSYEATWWLSKLDWATPNGLLLMAGGPETQKDRPKIIKFINNKWRPTKKFQHVVFWRELHALNSHKDTQNHQPQSGMYHFLCILGSVWRVFSLCFSCSYIYKQFYPIMSSESMDFVRPFK